MRFYTTPNISISIGSRYGGGSFDNHSSQRNSGRFFNGFHGTWHQYHDQEATDRNARRFFICEAHARGSLVCSVCSPHRSLNCPFICLTKASQHRCVQFPEHPLVHHRKHFSTKYSGCVPSVCEYDKIITPPFFQFPLVYI